MSLQNRYVDHKHNKIKRCVLVFVKQKQAVQSIQVSVLASLVPAGNTGLWRSVGFCNSQVVWMGQTVVNGCHQ